MTQTTPVPDRTDLHAALDALADACTVPSSGPFAPIELHKALLDELAKLNTRARASEGEPELLDAVSVPTGLGDKMRTFEVGDRISWRNEDGTGYQWTVALLVGDGSDFVVNCARERAPGCSGISGVGNVDSFGAIMLARWLEFWKLPADVREFVSRWGGAPPSPHVLMAAPATEGEG